MKHRALLAALAVVVAACGGSDSDSSATTAEDSPTTVTTSSSPSTTATTTSGSATTADGGGSGTAKFSISRVVFGDDGFVSVTNVGDAAGSLDGWQLCQRPAYFGIGPVEVAAGETVHFTTGDPAGLSGQVIDSAGRFGTFSAEDGEIALYADNSFGSASSIRSYVEWGEAGHGRSSVAVEAGIWDGGFVASGASPGIAATVDVATGVADWTNS